MYQKLQKTIAFREAALLLNEKSTPIAVTGLSECGKSLFSYAFSMHMFEKGVGTVLVAPDEISAKIFVSDLVGLGLTPLFYPYVDIVLHSTLGESTEFLSERLATLEAVLNHDGKSPLVVVTTAEALPQLTVPKTVLKRSLMTICVGDELSISDLLERLVKMSYVRSESVDGVGQFSKRGGIVDIFSPSCKEPVRIEFFGDTVDTISHFAPDTQRRTSQIDKFFISPATQNICEEIPVLADKLERLIETYSKKRDTRQYKMLVLERLKLLEEGRVRDKLSPLLYERETTLLDYLDNSLVLISEERNVARRIDDSHSLHIEELKNHYEDGNLVPELGRFSLIPAEIWNKIEAHPSICLDMLPHSRYENAPKGLVSAREQTASHNFESMELLFAEISDLLSEGYTIDIFAKSEERAKRLDSILRGAKLPLEKITVHGGSLHGGVLYPAAKIAVLSDGERTNRPKKKRKTPAQGEKIRTYSDLALGDYVVHQNHGIGQYMGIHQLKVEGALKDYIKINYSGKDVLYVPANQLDMVYKFIGAENKPKVKLSKMGGAAWQAVKTRVKAAAKDMAQELIALYAARSKVEGFAFPPDSEWQAQFEESFEYVETDDQLRSVAEIKKDMERTFPMDRLLCGDVGFGKTEVAVRAAFKAIESGKQVAILVPTTILAWQHFTTILNRFSAFPMRIDTLSRFRTPGQQEAILRRLKTGELDMVIGTHRILQKDIAFKDLGLVIIDEEQRFGVAHKEKLKALAKNVDVLTLTATPIPRTLNMALSGIRDISVIDTPPHDRQPVQTYVLEYDENIIADACRKEARRGGQVFYLYNRVETIERTAAKLRERLPELNIVTAHGKMSESELSEIWGQMVSGEIDVLVCTTIIETGIDVPNANTLIIEDADRLGLSQLYQIRGRVGRSTRRAYAFFTYRPGKVITEDATKRLATIREFTQFGSGFKIAMRDLEIRGAGNVLGAEQHGHMELVGYDMYLKLLDEAVLTLQGKEVNTTPCSVDFIVDANIDEKYIESAEIRIDIYKKIAALQNDDDLSDLYDELVDRFGDVPKALQNLCRIALLRARAGSLRIEEIVERNGNIIISAKNLSMELISAAIANCKGKLLFSAGEKPYLTMRLKGEPSLPASEHLIEEMQKIKISLDCENSTQTTGEKK